MFTVFPFSLNSLKLLKVLPITKWNRVIYKENNDILTRLPEMDCRYTLQELRS
jgi:hypothetical protein